MSANDFQDLTSMLELCYGDVDEEEGFQELQDQLEVYPQRVEPFLQQLSLLNQRKDGRLAQELLEEYAHFSATPEESLDWFRSLQADLEKAGVGS